MALNLTANRKEVIVIETKEGPIELRMWLQSRDGSWYRAHNHTRLEIYADNDIKVRREKEDGVNEIHHF